MAARNLPLTSAAMLLASILFLSACQKAEVETATQAVDPTLVTPSEELLANIKVGPVQSTNVSETLRVSGKLDFDEQNLARIGATVEGRVTHINAQLGQEVKPGQVLGRIHSTALGQAQLAYLKARGTSDLNRRALERAKVLFAADVIAAAELQRRENEASMADAEARAMADQLKVLGMNAAAIERLAATGAIESYSPVVASVAGRVVERKVTQGQVVQPADALFTVANLSRLWAVARVPEQQASQVQVGQTMTIEVPALADERFSGKLIFVGDTVDPETRTVMVRTELNNDDRRLKPAMLATMLIASAPRQRLTVPTSAVVREDNTDHVFVASATGPFRLTKVQLGPEANGVRTVISGIKEGDSIVTEGAFHLNNERNRVALEGE